MRLKYNVQLIRCTWDSRLTARTAKHELFLLILDRQTDGRGSQQKIHVSKMCKRRGRESSLVGEQPTCLKALVRNVECQFVVVFFQTKQNIINVVQTIVQMCLSHRHSLPFYSECKGSCFSLFLFLVVVVYSRMKYTRRT